MTSYNCCNWTNLKEAKSHWTSVQVQQHKHTIDHPISNACFLDHLLLHSIMDDFSMAIINQIPQNL
jgi:hypothetical protein